MVGEFQFPGVVFFARVAWPGGQMLALRELISGWTDDTVMDDIPQECISDRFFERQCCGGATSALTAGDEHVERSVELVDIPTSQIQEQMVDVMQFIPQSSRALSCWAPSAADAPRVGRA